MTHARTMLRRVLAPALLLAAPTSALAVVVPADAGPVSSSARAATETIYQETFERGTAGWTTSSRARLSTVDHGRRSDAAARLRVKAPGAAVARTKVGANALGSGTHKVGAWMRSTRGAVRATLVAREVEPSTGKVLGKARDRAVVRGSWQRTRLSLPRTSSTSVVKVSVRTKQQRADRVLIDDVSVKRARTTTPPTSPPPSAGGFPDASNTGVPDGVALSAYTGPMTITAAGTVIDAKKITGTLFVKAPNVTITRSQVNGTVYLDGSGSVSIADSTVDAGTDENSAIGQYNLTLRRVEVLGGRQSVSCNENCDIQDSWLHGQYMKPGSDWHGDGFISNGGSNMLLRHNTLACDSEPTGNGGACSAALAAYGDFAPITDLTVDNNLFVQSPAAFCMYAGYDPAKPSGKAAARVKVTNNVFARGSNGKCASFGPVTAVAPSGNGNVFSGNVWDDGKSVPAP